MFIQMDLTGIMTLQRKLSGMERDLAAIQVNYLSINLCLFFYFSYKYLYYHYQCVNLSTFNIYLSIFLSLAFYFLYPNLFVFHPANGQNIKSESSVICKFLSYLTFFSFIFMVCVHFFPFDYLLVDLSV